MHHVKIRDEIVDRVMQRRGRLHIYDELVASKTAFVVIDMQNAFCEKSAPAEVPMSRSIVPNINLLAEKLRQLGGFIVWITSEFSHKNGISDWENFFTHIVADEVRERTMEYMSPGGPGTPLWHELDVNEQDIFVIKNRYGCFSSGSSQLERVLRSRGIDTILIGGTKTNVCCETTARAGFDMDFNVVMVDDCNAALSDGEHLATLESMIQQFGDVLTADEVISILK